MDNKEVCTNLFRNETQIQNEESVEKKQSTTNYYFFSSIFNQYICFKLQMDVNNNIWMAINPKNP